MNWQRTFMAISRQNFEAGELPQWCEHPRAEKMVNQFRVHCPDCGLTVDYKDIMEYERP